MYQLGWKLALAFCCVSFTNHLTVCGQKNVIGSENTFSSAASGSNIPTSSVAFTFDNTSMTRASALNADAVSTASMRRTARDPHITTSGNVFVDDILSNMTVFTNKNSSAPDPDDENSVEDSDSSDLSPQPSVSQEEYEAIMAVLDMVLIVIEVISVILTATSAGVYLLRTMRCTTAVYLVALNVADTLCGALVACRSVWKYVGGVHASRTLAYNYMTLVGPNYLGLSLRRCVYCLSVIVCLERFFVIAFPLKARHFKIIRFPKITVFSLMLAVFTFHVYLPLKYQVEASVTGSTFWIGYTGRYRDNRKAFDIVSNVAKFLFAYIPVFVGVGLSVALLLALKSHVSTRATLHEMGAEKGLKQSRSSAERQLAWTIWLSTALFTLLSLPANTVHLVSTHHHTFGFLKLDHRLYTLVTRFCYLGLIVTRYTNFFSYLCLSTAFRRSLIRGILPRGIAAKFQGTSMNEKTTGKGRSTYISTISSSNNQDI